MIFYHFYEIIKQIKLGDIKILLLLIFWRSHTKEQLIKNLYHQRYTMATTIVIFSSDLDTNIHVPIALKMNE